MRDIESVPRPQWVVKATDTLMAEAAGIALVQERIADLARGLVAEGVHTDELVDAAHDLQHAWKHLTSARRALSMSWPHEG